MARGALAASALSLGPSRLTPVPPQEEDAVRAPRTWYVSQQGTALPSCGTGPGTNSCASLSALLLQSTRAAGGLVLIEGGPVPFNCSNLKVAFSVSLVGSSSEFGYPEFDCKHVAQIASFLGGASNVTVRNLIVNNCRFNDGGCLAFADVRHVSLATVAFRNSVATGHGGALSFLYEDVTRASLITIANCSFENISTDSTTDGAGGAISVLYSKGVLDSAVVLTGGNRFYDCRARGTAGSGGAVFVEYVYTCVNGSVVLNGNNSFHLTRAERGGGALHVHYNGETRGSSVAVQDRSMFQETKAGVDLLGGAIGVTYSHTCAYSTVAIHGENQFFGVRTGNYSYVGGGYGGGAVGVHYGKLSMECSVLLNGSNVVQNASASSGGGALVVVHKTNSTADTVQVIGSNKFVDCSASSGGAIYVSYSGVVTNSSVAVYGSNTFRRTRAGDGGAVLVWYDGNDEAMSVGSNVTVAGRNAFEETIALSFANGRSGEGGALSVYHGAAAENCHFLVTGANRFLSTMAKQLGGVLFVDFAAAADSCSAVVEGANIFKNSSTKASGGMLYFVAGWNVYYSTSHIARNVNFAIVGPNIFQRGRGLLSGGCAEMDLQRALHPQKNSMTVNGATFSDCAARVSPGSGGALRVLCSGDLPDVPSYASSMRHRRWFRSCSSLVRNITIVEAQGVQGGGVTFENGGCILDRVTIANSSASEAGGAVRVDGTASIFVKSTVVNGSSSASGGAFSFVNSANVPLEDVDVHASPEEGSTVLSAQEASSIRIQNTTVLCSPGFVVQHASQIFEIPQLPWSYNASECCLTYFLTVECMACKSPNYTLARGRLPGPNVTCMREPFGSKSFGGADLRARPGFWGYRSESAVHMIACPSGYCCPPGLPCPTYSFCQPGRTGLLCGDCLGGLSQAYGSSKCVPDSRCSPYGFGFIAVSFALAGTLWFLLFPDPSAGKLILFFFYQVAPLLIVDPAHSGPWMSSVSAIFRFRIPASANRSEDNESWHLCPFVGATMVDTVLLHLLVPFLVLSSLQCAKSFQRSLPKYFGRANFDCALLAAILLLYSSALDVTFAFLHCVPIDGTERLFLKASVLCESEWIVPVSLMGAILFCFPPGLLLLQKWAVSSQGVLSEEVQSALRMPFRNGMPFWNSSILFYRLVMTSIYSFVQDMGARLFILSVLCVSFLAIHMRVLPYKGKMNAFETLCLSSLVFISLVNLLQASFDFVSLDVSKSGVGATMDNLHVAQSIVFLLPACIATISFIIEWKKRRGRTKHEKMRQAKESVPASQPLLSPGGNNILTDE